MSEVPQAFLELVRRKVEGEASSEDHRELEALLQDDPQLCRVYVEYLMLDGALMRRSQEKEGALAALESGPQGARVLVFPWKRMWRLVATAAALVLCSLGYIVWGQRSVPMEILFVSKDASVPFRVGEVLRAKHLEWALGRVQMRLPSGVQLEVEAPADLKVLSSMQIYLAAGKVTADVGDQGKGFVIDTAQGRIVDRGTVFGVTALSASATDVVVFQGKVEVYHEAERKDFIPLNAGEAIRLQPHRRASRIMRVTDGQSQGTWTTKESVSVNTLISEVGDSMETDEEGVQKWPSLKNFYVIMPQGLRDGVPAFADSEDPWVQVPAALSGADLVRTFAIDRFNWWMKMSVTLRRPCELFVFWDVRSEPPEWLSRDFTRTADTLFLETAPHRNALGGKGGQGQPSQGRRLEFVVWKKVVAQPGIVTLGPPYANPPEDRKSFRAARMYSVAAKALPQPTVSQ